MFVETMSYLPIGLKPRKGIHYTPPKFVYGWLMSSDEICTIIEMHHSQLIGMNTYDDETYIDVNDTLDLVRAHFVNELKIGKRWRPEWESVIDVTKTRFAALAITDSYSNGNATPPKDVMDKVKEFFHLDSEPRWFLDLVHDRWRKRHLFRLRTGELEATTDF